MSVYQRIGRERQKAAWRATREAKAHLWAPLYRSGLTLAEIGKRYGVTATTVSKMITEFYGDISAESVAARAPKEPQKRIKTPYTDDEERQRKLDIHNQAMAAKRAAAGGAFALNKEWNTKNREKYLAHKAVETALRTGRLQRKPCERCGETKLVHAHHDDYSKRREVMWLCPLHHKQRHRELRNSERGGVA